MGKGLGNRGANFGEKMLGPKPPEIAPGGGAGSPSTPATHGEGLIILPGGPLPEQLKMSNQWDDGGPG